MRLFLTVAVALSVSACGTVTRGSNEDVTFNSEPAGAKVTTSTGLVCAATPCTFPISRKQEFIATFEMPGHHPQQIEVKTEVSGGGAAGMAGNVVAGGLIGVAVDASTGASYDHTPNPVFARMVPIRPERQPVVPSRQRRSGTPGV